jgi:NADPH-dependent 2,4-dienoyl-CoA reductase/sulfur reductase-like enzyme
VLLHMSVATEPRLYVLGSYETRVTIYSQQIRAFNLAYALASVGQLGANSRVAVVGGGVAGVTFAAAASRMGGTVVLFERRSQILHLLRGCHTRHLHPNVYDWPSRSSCSLRFDRSSELSTSEPTRGCSFAPQRPGGAGSL